MAKVLMVNVPYAGHTNPTLPLAAELVRRGHTVFYINAPEFRDKIEATGAVFLPYRDYPAKLTAQQKKTSCFMAAYTTAMQLEDNFDILIYEMFFYPGKVIAEQKKIPCIRQFSQPAWNSARVKEATIMWKLSCRLIDVQIMGKKKAVKMGMEGKTLMNSVLSDKADLNVVYVPNLFQPQRETFDESYFFVCPPMDTKKLSEVKIPYAQMKHPIIYISLGSIMSNKRFCKECIKAFGRKDVSVILSTGKVNPAQLGKIPPNLYVYSFVPQLEVLQNTDLFLTHGGMNSVNEAMYFGVPMLVMPVLNDQPFNAKRIVELQIGQRMRAVCTNASLIYRNAMALLDDGRYKKNAAQLSRSIQSGTQFNDIISKIEEFMKK